MQKDCNAWLAISLSIEFSIGVVGNRKYKKKKENIFLTINYLFISLFSCFVCSCERIGLRAKFAYLKNSSTFAMSNNERGWTKT